MDDEADACVCRSPADGQQERVQRRAFRGFDEDREEESALIGVLAAVPTWVCLAADCGIALHLSQLLSSYSIYDLPADFLAESIYLVVTTAIACTIDMHALLAMFSVSHVRKLNWAAATGIILSVLKLSIVNKVRNYDNFRLPTISMAYDLMSGQLQLNPLVRDGSEWHLESVYGSACCAYLATYFAMSVLYNEDFRIDRFARKMVLYAVSGTALGMFSGLFASQSSMGWLLVLHALLVAWAVAQCKTHSKS